MQHAGSARAAASSALHANAAVCFCRYNGPTQASIRVKYFPNPGSLSGIAPFNTVYGAHPSRDKTEERGMLVVQPDPKSYVVLEVDDRQVECLLTCGKECEGHCP